MRRAERLKNHAARKFRIKFGGKMAREPRLADAGQTVNRRGDGGARARCEQFTHVVRLFCATDKAGVGARRGGTLPRVRAGYSAVQVFDQAKCFGRRLVDAVDLVGDTEEQGKFVAEREGERANEAIGVRVRGIDGLRVVQRVAPVVAKLAAHRLAHLRVVERVRQRRAKRCQAFDVRERLTANQLRVHVRLARLNAARIFSARSA